MPFGNISAIGTWKLALSRYASSDSCEEITTEESSAFARVWIYCFTLGLVTFATILVPRLFGSDTGARSWDDKGDAELPPPPPPLNKRKPAKASPSRLASAVADGVLDFNAAEENLKETSPQDENGNLRPVWGTKISDLREVGGVGIELYFRLLVNLGLLFTFMTLLNLPLTMFNLHGNFAPDSGSLAIMSSIGNLGNVALAPGFSQEQRQMVVGCQAQDIRELTPIFAWLDFVSCCCFMLCIGHFYFVTVPNYRRVADKATVQCGDFAVEVYALPERLEGDRHQQYQALLKEFIAERLAYLGGDDIELARQKVREVALVRHYSQQLGTLRERAEARFKRTVEEQKGNQKNVEKYTKIIEKLSDNLEKSKDGGRPENDRPVLRAYVILHSTRDVAYLLKSYRYSQFLLMRWFALLPCFSHHRFEGSTLRIRRAPEPTNLLWENLDTPRFRHWLRWFAAIFAWAVIIIVSILIVYAFERLTYDRDQVDGLHLGGSTCGTLSESAGNAVFGGSGKFHCDPLEAGLLTDQEAKQLTNDAEVDCFCLAKGYSAIAKRGELRDICEDWVVQKGSELAFSIICSLIIVGINCGLLYLLTALSIWQRPASVSALDTAVMVKCYVAQVLNTGMIIFFVHYKGLRLFDGHFDDFDRGWYSVVGRQLIQVMAMNTFSTAASYLLIWLVYVVRRSCCRGRAKHQVDLIQMYTNPPFDLSGRLSVVLMTVFVTMVYSPGLPLLYPLAVVFFIASYWADKLVLLRGSFQPPQHDGTTAEQAAAHLLVSVPAHCVFAIMMYGHPCVFPANQIGGHLSTVSEMASNMADSANNMNTVSTAEVSDGYTERATRETTWMFLVLLLVWLVCSVLLSLLWVAGSACGNILECLKSFICTTCCCCCGGRAKVSPSDRADFMGWDEAREHIEKVSPPASYKLERSPDFEPYIAFMWSDDGLGEGGEVPAEDTGPPLDVERGAEAADVALFHNVAPRGQSPPPPEEAPLMPLSPQTTSATDTSQNKEAKESDPAELDPIFSRPSTMNALAALSPKDEEAEEEDC